MKTAKIVAISTLATASALYTGFWFYQSSQIEKQTMALVQKAKDDATVQNMTLEYKEIAKGGFPFQHRVKIVEPKISSLNPSDELRWISAGGVTLVSKVFSSDSGTFVIDGDVNFAVSRKAEQPEAEEAAKGNKEEIFKIQFASAPSLTVNVNQAQELKGFSYSDTGFSATDGSGNKIAAWEGTKFSLATKSEADERLTYDVSLNTSGEIKEPVHAAAGEGEKTYKFGKTSFGLDSSFNAPASSDKWVSSDLKLDIRKFELNSELFNVSVKGDVQKQATAMLPVAKLNVAIKPVSVFTEFVESNGGSVGEMADGGDSGKGKLKDIFEKLSDAQNLDGDAFATTIVADEGGNVKIGQLTMEQAIAAISGAPIVPMSPAAGNFSGDATDAAPAAEETKQPEPQAAPSALPPKK